MMQRVIPVAGAPVQVPSALAAQIAAVCESILSQVLPQFGNQLGNQLLAKVTEMIAEATGEPSPERLAVTADGSDPIPGVEYVDEVHEPARAADDAG